MRKIVIILSLFFVAFFICPCAATEDHSIPYGTSYEINLDSPEYETVYLTFFARIQWNQLEGWMDPLKITVNGKLVTASQLVNKNPDFTTQDGQSDTYYNPAHSSWRVFYRPDFSSINTANSPYQVITGDAGEYTFDITSMVKRDDTNSIILQHAANEWINESGAEDANTIKSTILVVEDIELQGIGNPIALPSVATPAPSTTKPLIGADLSKSINPQKINLNQIITVTVIIRNSGQTTLTDIEIVDTVPTDFEYLNGETQLAFSELKPGETRGIQYTAQSKGAGNFMVDAATARFTDQNGNYQTINSRTPMVEVVSPLSDVPIATTSPGFGGFAAIIGILSLLGVLIKR